ncbi:hypothetical protein LUCX_42 [Xanthomonas phage vB_XciM_LucasX]|nr:hypothetical protein LUCX_42 [Xanthomonas phage vB_XciM_LucasX]
MGAIQKAIQEVKFDIPKEILQEVFVTREFGRTATPASLDAMIREKVITARVMEDCNLLGGTQVELPLVSVNPEMVDQYKLVYRIPMSLTQNRRISRVVALTIGQSTMMNSSYMGVEGYSQIMEASQGMMQAQAGIPVVSTAYVRLIAENTILVTDYMSLPRNAFLRCYLENDDEFSQLNPQTYPHFQKLVLLAVKAYIYTNAVIPMGMGQLVGGMELGRFREIVDSYSDANQMYADYIREVWTKVLYMNDPRSKERSLRWLVGGNN